MIESMFQRKTDSLQIRSGESSAISNQCGTNSFPAHEHNFFEKGNSANGPVGSDSAFDDSNADLPSRNKTVLIVDSSEAAQEVLSTALERHGVRTLSTRFPRHGVQIAKKVQPDLIVLDLEAHRLSPEETMASFSENDDVSKTPIVVLGTVRMKAPVGESEFVAKPYHFAPLIQKIEEMLAKTEDEKTEF